MCHAPARLAGAVTTLAALGLVLAPGCARKSGWERLDRVCDASSPPRVCFDASPDAPASLRVGGVELVPGECAVSPRKRGGRIRVVVRDGRSGGETEERGVGTRRGATTWVRYEGAGELRVRRAGCSTEVDAEG